MSSIGLLTMLAVRLRSRGTVDTITATVAELNGSGKDTVAARVERELDRAVDEARIRHRGDEGRHSLTAAGEAELNAMLAAELTGPERADITTAYEAFLPLNRRFLAACVAWQDGLVALDDFRRLVDELVPILDCLHGIRTRFESYAPRLIGGLTAATQDAAWIDSPSRDSVHTVWFELHEHLLASLGRDRVDER